MSAITPTPPHSILTVAPITAFGFLDNTVAPITVETGRGKINATDWNGKPTGLSVPEGKTLALIGGNLEIKNGTFYETQKTKNGKTWVEAIRLGSLTAPHGIIQLASVNSKGQVIPTDTDLDVSSCPQLGKIIIFDKSLIDISGRGAGKIFLRTGQLDVHASDIYANTRGDQDGGIIDIQVDTLSFLKDWWISVSSWGTGLGSSIYLRTKNSRNKGVGNAGNLNIEANQVLFKDGAQITTRTYGGGDGGNITITQPSPTPL